ncbi:hypothetical protein LEL_02945 [Akanthomyces lecanii RCEF 1005]|uniref:Uncharacterized protein n=1 Tax=Akanthomyces lecanii RCEF 1005 TaxID=1081108 RepID=A0A168IN20_CORDF|nr:hypothetical protein LEL_02945 [Akanthomyces lecanii RCEF 1005]
MASQSSGNVEILVHVAAPSRVSDDAAYRRLAQAYLSFAPGSRAHITIPSSPEPPQQPPPSRQSHHYDDDFAVLQSFCSDSQDMSFRGALDNRNSPCVVARRTRLATPPPQVLPDENVTTPTTAVRQLPSQIADSYPMPDCDIFNVTPTRVLQRYMGNRQPAFTPAAPAPSSSPALSSRCDYGEAKDIKIEAHAIDVPILSSLSAQEPGRTQENRERRQATIPVTPLVSESSRKRKALDSEHVQDTSGLDVTHISSSVPSSDASSIAAFQRAETDPLPSKRLRQLAQDSGAVHLVRSGSDNAHQPHPPQDTPTFSSPLSYNALSQIPSTHPSSSSSSSSLAVRPPSPPVGIDHLDHASLVSAKLAKLAHDLSSRYRPTMHRSTTLDPLERGHWRVDCSTWPPAQRADAWAFLVSYIRSGLAGWGVWCRRSADSHEIKLYGWAHVAKHTYLLLYLASGRHIKATGAKWFDAEGVVAVEVVP